MPSKRVRSAPTTDESANGTARVHGVVVQHASQFDRPPAPGKLVWTRRDDLGREQVLHRGLVLHGGVAGEAEWGAGAVRVAYLRKGGGLDVRHVLS